MALPTTVSGFTVLPVSYSHSTHYIYARAHAPTKSDKILPAGRTLFLVNVPPDATERELVLLFKHCGTVEKVVFGAEATDFRQNEESDDEEEEAEPMEEDDGEGPRKRKKTGKGGETVIPKVISLLSTDLRKLGNTGRTVHVIFLDNSSLERALTPRKARPWPTSSDVLLGLSHYISLHKSLRPPLDSVREHADSAVAVYEYELAKSKQKSKYRKGEAIVDEDGFTLVTRGGAYGQTLGGGVAVASKRFQQTGHTARTRMKKEKKEKEGFYAFQKAEKQRKELMDLKRKWEEDKTKVEKLKASRRFKPY